MSVQRLMVITQFTFPIQEIVKVSFNVPMDWKFISIVQVALYLIPASTSVTFLKTSMEVIVLEIIFLKLFIKTVHLILPVFF